MRNLTVHAVCVQPKMFSHKALVTGGGTGIGKAIAGALASNGAKVYIAARKESLLKEVRLPRKCSLFRSWLNPDLAMTSPLRQKKNSIAKVQGRLSTSLRTLGYVSPFFYGLLNVEVTKNKDGCDALIAEIKKRESKLHILVNNSGVTWGAPYDNFPETKGWDNIFNVNVKSIFYSMSHNMPAYYQSHYIWYL